VLPTWLVLGCFFLLPLVIMLVISFGQRGTYGGLKPIADLWAYFSGGEFLANYRRSIEPLYLSIYWRSLWMAIVTTVLCLVVSYPIAYYIAIVVPVRYKNLLLACRDPVLDELSDSHLRLDAHSADRGLLNTVLLATGTIDQPLNLLYTDFAVMIGLVYGELPFMILPLYASLEKLDLSLLEASLDLGANKVATFFRITVPLTMPGIVAASSWSSSRRSASSWCPTPGRREEHPRRKPHSESVRGGPQQAIRVRHRLRAHRGRADPPPRLRHVHQAQGQEVLL